MVEERQWAAHIKTKAHRMQAQKGNRQVSSRDRRSELGEGEERALSSEDAVNAANANVQR